MRCLSQVHADSISPRRSLFLAVIPMRVLSLILAGACVVSCAAGPIENTVDGGGSTAENCLDGIDNDSDGFVDCSDQDCGQAGACRGFGDVGTTDTGAADTGATDTGTADTGNADSGFQDTGEGTGSGEGFGCTTDPSICTADQHCDNGACVNNVYQHVAIVSRAVENPANHGNTPGPDLDAVAVKSGGVSSFAASVVKVIQGRVSDPEGNVNAASSAIIGANDAMTDTTGGTCNLAEGQGFFSLGYGDDPQGIVILAMPNAIQQGDSLAVYEVGNGFCSNISTVREDSFEVYVGPLNADLTVISNLATLVGQGFKLAGSQSALNGGIFEFAAP